MHAWDSNARNGIRMSIFPRIRRDDTGEGGVALYLHSFLISSVDGCDW